MDKKIEYLYSAISDAQELIRFIDNKTAFAITILGVYFVTFFSSIDKIIKYSFGYSFWFWFLLSSFILLLLLCIVVTVKIIKPTINPIDNIVFGNKSQPLVKFFLMPNDYPKASLYSFTNSTKFKLRENFESYTQNLISISDMEIIDSLTLELFKVSFIRNIKNDRFNTLLNLLFFTTIFFLVTFILFSLETYNSIEKIKLLQKSCLFY